MPGNAEQGESGFEEDKEEEEEEEKLLRAGGRGSGRRGLRCARISAVAVLRVLPKPLGSRGPESFLEVPSTVGCDAVMAWQVVIRPRLMPNLSSSALVAAL